MPISIEEIAQKLHEGKIILYPTDTIYGIGCDATNERAIDKLFDIKKRPKSKSLIVLVQHLEMLKQYVSINNEIEQFIATLKIPTTIIYSNPRNLASNTINADGTVAIRIPNHAFCQALLQAFGKPIISTSANISGENNPIHFNSISKEIKAAVDIVIGKEMDTSTYQQASVLVKINKDFSLEYIRK